MPKILHSLLPKSLHFWLPFTLTSHIENLIEMEARSGSMDPALITPEYIYRMWGGKVPLEDIEAALKQL